MPGGGEADAVTDRDDHGRRGSDAQAGQGRQEVDKREGLQRAAISRSAWRRWEWAAASWAASPGTISALASVPGTARVCSASASKLPQRAPR